MGPYLLKETEASLSTNTYGGKLEEISDFKIFNECADWPAGRYSPIPGLNATSFDAAWRVHQKED